MKAKVKSLAFLAAAALIILVLAAGCTTARKPAPTTPENGPSVTAPRTSPSTGGALPTKPAEMHSLALKIAGNVEKVPGVRKASVVLTGRTCILGLDIKPGVEASGTERIKREAARKVRTVDKRVTTVRVTTDMGLVTRIRRVSDGISKGTPMSSFTKETGEILRRISPAAK
jgi:YhcN/YlaJ family sporulation lipoprotein